jgi:hypothetical protein
MEHETKAYVIRAGTSWDVAHQETMVSVPQAGSGKCPFRPQATSAEAGGSVALASEESRHER